MHELLDIVDENDEVLGRASRPEVHRTRRMHRAVHMFVFNAGGDLFLQKRAASKSVYPNYWDSSAAGHVDAGEHYLAAAVRELEEELGVVIAAVDIKEFWRRLPTADNGHEHQRYYAVTTEQTLSPCPIEIADGRWLSQSDMQVKVAADDQTFTTDLKLAWPVYRAWSNQ